jgi:hypothetical protein
MIGTRPLMSAILAGLLASGGLLAVGVSPALAAQGGCRDPHYLANGWDATICSNPWNALDPSGMSATGIVSKHPSNCSYYRAYVVDQTNGALLYSTAAKPCSTTAATTATAFWNQFVLDRNFEGHAISRLDAWDSSNRPILEILGPAVVVRQSL